jgi:hypothetical protein
MCSFRIGDGALGTATPNGTGNVHWAVCRSREKINENSRFCANFAPKMTKKGAKIGI